MSSATHDNLRTAVNDRQRRGILIPAGELADTHLSPGDRFRIKMGQGGLFVVTLIKDPEGDIFFDRSGVFIERTRRVDSLLGGIFDTYAVEIVDADPPMLRVKTVDPGLDAIR
jgi:hypothetical protein